MGARDFAQETLSGAITADAYPADGLALLDEVKKFLRAENLMGPDFAVAQWQVPEA